MSAVGGPKPQASARYWRVFMLSEYAGGGSAIGLVEMDFLDSSDTVLSTGGTADASNEAFGAVENLFDSDTGTIWATNTDYNHWVSYDFGSDVEVAKIRMQARSGSNAQQAPRSGYLQYSSDNTNWSEAWYFAVESQFNSLEERTFENEIDFVQSARYWRIELLDPFGASLNDDFSFQEVELRTSVGGSDVTSSWTATASQTDSGAAANLIDDNSGTEWSGGGGAARAWIKLDAGVGNSEAIVEFAITASATTPTDWFDMVGLSRSDDDVTYTPVCWFLESSTPSASQQRTFAVANSL